MADSAVFVHDWAQVVAHQLPARGRKKNGNWVVTNRHGDRVEMTNKEFRQTYRSQNRAAAVALGEAE